MYSYCLQFKSMKLDTQESSMRENTYRVVPLAELFFSSSASKVSFVIRRGFFWFKHKLDHSVFTGIYVYRFSVPHPLYPRKRKL